MLGEPRPLLSEPLPGPPGSGGPLVSGGARRCAVLGSPISHSLSPALHRAAYAALGLGWSYEAVDVDAAGLPGFLASLDVGWRGLSLTMPLKRAVFPMLDSVQPLAARVGAANTVVLDDDGRHGFNTDVPGLVAALSEGGVDRPRRVLVLGAGATAASTLAALAELGRPDGSATAAVLLAVRDAGRAVALRRLAEDFGLAVALAGLADLAATATGPFDLIVSTLPAGAVGPELAAAAIGALTPGATVCDVVYDGWPTPLARAGTAAGAVVVSGTDLLVHQALGQIVAFTGRAVPVGVLRAALPEALREPLSVAAQPTRS